MICYTRQPGWPGKFFRLAVGALLVALWSMPAHTAPASEKVSADQADTEVRVAPVVVDGVKLFRVRGISAFPAEQRAAQIAARIEALADSAMSTDTLNVVEVEGNVRILAGEQVILTVLDVDAQLEELDPLTLARVYVKRIADVIAAYRHDRTPEQLQRSALLALAATIGLIVFLWIGRRLFRRFDAALDLRLKARLAELEAQSRHILSAKHVWNTLRGVRNFLSGLLILLAVIIYLDFVLHLFPWTRYAGARLLDLLLDPLRTLGFGVLAALPNLAFLVVLYFVTRYVLKTVRLFFIGLEQGNLTVSNFERDWAQPTYRLVRLVIVAFALVVAYPYIPGSQTDAFKGVSLFIGLVFSLGSSSVIGNVIAGYTMIYRRAFHIGDRIRINDHVGDVAQTRLLVTHLRTPKNEEVIIPNSEILNNSVVNYSTLAREGKLILHTTVGIGYETPWRQVEAMLLLAAGRTEGLLQEPAPFVLQKALADFAVTYEINACCNNAQAMNQLYTKLHRNILDVFNEYGVQIMTPAYEGDPEQPKIVPKDQWHIAPADQPK